MNKLKANLLVCAALSSFAMHSTADSTQSKDRELSTDNKKVIDHVEYIAAVAKKRKNPKYPIEAARNGQEGWVLLNYAVNQQGKVEEVVVVDSSGNQYFEKNARKAVKKWRYEPAKKNGETVYACQNLVRLDYTLESSNKAVTEEFSTLYSELFDAIEKGDNDGARDKVAQINQRDAWNFTEISYANQASLAFAQYDQDLLMQEYYARQSLQEFDYLDKINYEQLFIVLVALETYVQNGAFHDAQKLYQTYFREDKELPTDKESQAVIAKVEKIMTLVDKKIEEAVLLRTAQINPLGIAHHTLSRNKFSITQIEGGIDNVEVRCDSKFAEMELAPDEVVEIPVSWGKCGITIHGDDKTTLKIYEHGQSPSV